MQSSVHKKRWLRRIIILVLIPVFLITAGAVARVIYRGALKSQKSIKSPGIDEVAYISIGDIEQWIYIRGQDVNNPVLLIIHGGPGYPISPSLHLFQYDLEDKFTVVQWDQRLSGKTFFKNDFDTAREKASFAQSCNDAWEVVQFLQNHLDQERIIVMGHSWGSSLGLWLAAEHPEALEAYIGVGQAVNLYDNERIGYENALKAAQLAENQEDIDMLMSLEPYPVRPYKPGPYYRAVGSLRQIQQKYDFYQPASSWLETFNAWTSPYYSLHELSYFTRDDITYLHEAENRYLMEDYDAYSLGLTYQIPFFIIQGEKDIITSTVLAEEFFEEITAPSKRIFIIPNTAHVPMTEDSESFTSILKDEILPLLTQVEL